MLISWTEIHIACPGTEAMNVSNQLELLGAKAVTFKDAEDDPIYEPDPQKISLWEQTIVVGLFEKKQVSESMLDYLQQFGEVNSVPLQNKDWVRLSLSQFQPIQFGKKLWVCPTWITPPDPNAINVLLDPGLAFGTGKHPTTSLCVEWLVNHLSGEKTVVDYGCGSGILGITAYKLGAEKIYAVDNDEQALIATRSNAQLNHIPVENIMTFFPKELPALQADLLIANILAGPLIILKTCFEKLIKPNGKILLSGILENQMSDVKKAYETHFDFDKPIIQEGWVCLAGSYSKHAE